MAEVTITVGGKNYAISCDDGEEGHLHTLAARVDAKVRDLRQSVAQAGDLRLMLMAALLLAEESAAATQKLESLEQAMAGLSDENRGLRDRLAETETLALETLEKGAIQAQDIAARLAHA